MLNIMMNEVLKQFILCDLCKNVRSHCNNITFFFKIYAKVRIDRGLNRTADALIIKYFNSFITFYDTLIVLIKIIMGFLLFNN